MTSDFEELELLLQGKLLKKIRDRMFSSLRTSYDLKQVEIEVMIFLYACPEQTAAEIAKKLYLQKGHVSLALERLREKKLVICKDDPDDRRVMKIALSEKGTRLYKEIVKTKETLSDVLLTGFSQDEIDVLTAFLKRIVENSRQSLEQTVSEGHCWEED